MDVNIKVPALELLVKYTASGIGAVAGPMLATWKAAREARAKLTEAKTKATSLKLIAEAQAQASQHLVPSDAATHTTLEFRSDEIHQRIEFQEKNRQANITSVLQSAVSELDRKEVADHEPDPDWTARFFDNIQDISSDDMQKLWAKILSREVEEQGRTSLRTLGILRNMTSTDAKTFERVCDFVINDEFIFYDNRYIVNQETLSYGNLLHLQELGLANATPLLIRRFNLGDENDSFHGYQNHVLKLGPITPNKTLKIDIPVVLLTVRGKQLFQFMKCRTQQSYLQSLSRFLRKKDVALSCARVIRRLSDEMVEAASPFAPIDPNPQQITSTKP